MLQYLQAHTRPDIPFAVSQLSRFMHWHMNLTSEKRKFLMTSIWDCKRMLCGQGFWRTF